MNLQCADGGACKHVYPRRKNLKSRLAEVLPIVTFSSRRLYMELCRCSVPSVMRAEEYSVINSDECGDMDSNSSRIRIA